MRVTLKMPRLGMNMQAAKIVEWFKHPGEAFAEGEPLYSIEADKVNMEVPAQGRGRLAEIVAAAGTEVQVGSPLCVIELAEPAKVG